MKKYNTKPIDFTGCHPVIAEALKLGEAIECWTRDCEESPIQLRKNWVCSYSKEETCPYITTRGIGWRYAVPIPLKSKRVMPPERAIPTLIAEGWEFNEYGDLVCPGEVIPASAFRCFGRLYDDYEAFVRFWPPCIIEEVEDE